MSTFVNTTARIGDTLASVYTAADRAILIGCNLANITGAALPCDVVLRKADGDTYIVKGKRVLGADHEEIMRGNKLVIGVGDSLLARTKVPDGFDVVLSLLEGV